MRKQFLYLSNDHLIAVVWSRGAAASEQAFAATPAGRNEFAEYLQNAAPLPTYLLTDLIEEDFRLDTVPHVNARDRKTMLERKLQQLYRTTPYRLANVIGRLSEGRRDDEVLLCALTNAELVHAWVDLLLAARVPVAGVYSIALTTQALLKTLQIKGKHTLWVSLQANAGWRQTYCQDGRVRFSRLTPVTGAQNTASLLTEEIGKTFQYLESINSFADSETLEVHVLAERDAQTALRASLTDSGRLRYVLHNLSVAAARLGLHRAPGANEATESTDATPLYLHVLNRFTHAEQFAPSAQRRYSDIRRVRLAMAGASVAFALAGTGLGAWNMLQAQSLRASINRFEGGTKQYESAHAATVAGFPKSKVNAQTMNEAVTYHEKVIRGAPNFSAFARELSVILEAFPGIRLDRLLWGTDAKANIALGYQVRAGEETSALVSSLPQAPPGSAAVAAGSGYYQAAVIEAAVYPFNGNYRAALAEIERLSRQLAGVRSAQVSALTLPLDTRAENQLRGSATPDKTQNEARFALYLRLAPTPQ
jgi:hypothetical protein